MLLLQETLGDSGEISKVLESILPLWEFIGLDAKGRSRGVAIGWHRREIKILNSWGVES
jgi:hypothetical protein